MMDIDNNNSSKINKVKIAAQYAKFVKDTAKKSKQNKTEQQLKGKIA